MTAMVTAALENNNNGGSVGGGGSRSATEAADRHCHDATRVEVNLSVLGILPRIRSGGSNGVKTALCGVYGGKFGKRGQYLFQSLEPTCAALSTDQISTPCAGKPKRA
jgi:hypothetical protein